MTLEKGTLLTGRYRILEILGEGGMGAVYRAHDESLNVTVAVKENLFTTEEYAHQFRIEAQILATLRHPNLTRVTDQFEQKDVQYIVMDYIDGEDLRDRMERLGILDQDEVIKIGAGLCDALTYLHGLTPTVLHRDIKPGNVRISPSGQVYLVDFGLAKIVQGNQMTVTGARAMTPGYSPPEQYGTARTDIRSDIYSLGATLYSALTAALPEDGLARAMKQVGLTPLRTHNPRIPRRLAAVIERSLAVQPEDRYQVAEDFRRALISARGITRRRLDLDEMLIPPPPDDASAAPTAQPEAFPDAPAPVSERGSAPISPARSIAFSDEVVQPVQPSSTTRRRGLRRLFGLAATLLITISIMALYIFPRFPGRLLGFIAGSSATPAEAPATATPPDPSHEPPSPVPSLTPMLSETSVLAAATIAPSGTPTPTPFPQPTETPTPTPEPTSPSDLAKIAFASDRSGNPQIWLMDENGGNLFQVTQMDGGACQPDWSPDGTQLVFISPCDGEHEEYPGSALFIVNADGTSLTPVIGSPNGDYDPDWSPDGSQILFTSLRNNSPEVYILDLDDGSVTLLASDGFKKNFHPAWNVDGTRIAFVSTRRGPFMVWIMNPDGSDASSFSRSGELKDASPAWSPDGRFLVFDQRELPNGTPSLVLAPLEDDGFSEIRLIVAQSPARQATYSPDGAWLAYEGWPDGENHDIYLLDLNTLTAIRLTEDPSFEFDPVWRP